MNITFPVLLNHFFCIFALYIPETTLLNKPFSKKNHIIYLLLITLLSFMPIFLTIHNFIPIFISILAIGILTDKRIFNMILALIGYIIGVIYNYLVLNIYYKITGINQAKLNTSVIHSLIFYIIFFSTLYLLLRLLKQLFITLQNINTYTHKSLSISLFLYLAFCVFIYVLNFTYEQKLGYSDDITSTNQQLFLVFFLFTAILLCVIIVTIYKDAITREALKEMEYLKKYTAEIEQLYSSIRSFKHDYTNILYSMKNYMNTQDYDSLQHYYTTNIIPLAESLDSSNPAIERLANMQIPELKSILYLKILDAEKYNIPVSLEIKWPISSINMQPVDLTRIIGIFLDNAIESVSNISIDNDRFINIAFIKQTENVIIIINNSAMPSNINLSQLKIKGISSKGKDRGIGLTNVNDILKKYPNVLMTTEYKNNIFTQTLEISDLSIY